MVKDMTEKGRLRNCMAVCDVSGTPMEVCVALGILLWELSEEPWRGSVITFSATPQMQKVVGETLKEKASFVMEMDWGGNTDFQAEFDRILAVTAAGSLPAEEMIKRVFVFSDMELDQASNGSWETDYMVIKRTFARAGYENSVREIVFWNMRNWRSTPVKSTPKGVV